jgi:hypothetical protein
MSVQDDKEEKVADRDQDQQNQNQDQDHDQDQDQGQGQNQKQTQGQDQEAPEKPEPDEKHKKKAAEMMTAYEDRPTVVLPGSGGMITGTAVNDWLDEDGNPKFGDAESADKAESDDDTDARDLKEQIEKDKALNEELRKAAKAENKGEKR